MGLVFEDPPKREAAAMSRAEIGQSLRDRPGEWAIVSRPDRAVRAQTTADRISDGREWGEGFEATVRTGADPVGIRVYARFRAPRRPGRSAT